MNEVDRIKALSESIKRFECIIKERGELIRGVSKIYYEEAGY